MWGAGEGEKMLSAGKGMSGSGPCPLNCHSPHSRLNEVRVAALSPILVLLLLPHSQVYHPGKMLLRLQSPERGDAFSPPSSLQTPPSAPADIEIGHRAPTPTPVSVAPSRTKKVLCRFLSDSRKCLQPKFLATRSHVQCDSPSMRRKFPHIIRQRFIFYTEYFAADASIRCIFVSMEGFRPCMVNAL